MATAKFKFSNFFIWLLIPMAVLMFAGIFFDMKMVASIYFVVLILAIVFLMLNKKYKIFDKNHTKIFVLFDLINLIAVVAIIYHEFSKHTLVLNIFLILLIIVELAVLCIDVFYIRNERINTQENLFISIVKLGSFICILTYFFNVSTLFFAIDALIFEMANIVIKILFKKFDIKEDNVETIEKDISNIEQLIDSASENEGEIE